MYDAFDLEIVVEYTGTDDSIVMPFFGTVEEVRQHIEETEGAMGWFYTIYGVRNDSSVDALIDVSNDKADYAYELLHWLEKLLEDSEKLKKVLAIVK